MKFIVDEEECRVEVLLTKAADLQSNFFKALFPTYKTSPSLSDIDENLHPLIRSMWQARYKTLQCCAGHGGLGFIIYRPYRGKKWRVVNWQPGVKIPQSTDELVNKADFGFSELTISVKMTKDKIKALIKRFYNAREI